jgi:hypothetical protein
MIITNQQELTLFNRRDNTIPGTIVRNSSIPEELGRISYLLTDKTGDYAFNHTHLVSERDHVISRGRHADPERHGLEENSRG